MRNTIDMYILRGCSSRHNINELLTKISKLMSWLSGQIFEATVSLVSTFLSFK
jgi:hypothetical protein